MIGCCETISEATPRYLVLPRLCVFVRGPQTLVRDTTSPVAATPFRPASWKWGTPRLRRLYNSLPSRYFLPLRLLVLLTFPSRLQTLHIKLSFPSINQTYFELFELVVQLLLDSSWIPAAAVPTRVIATTAVVPPARYSLLFLSPFFHCTFLVASARLYQDFN